MASAEAPNLAAEGAPPIGSRRDQNGGFAVTAEVTAKPAREAADVAAGIGRMIRGMSRRAESGDVQALVELDKLSRVLAAETLRAAHALNVHHEVSWAEIALNLGISKRAAYGRWGG